MNPEKSAFRREEKRLKEEIRDLERIALAESLLAGILATLIGVIVFPQSPAGFVCSVALIFAAVFGGAAVTYLLVSDDIEKREQQIKVLKQKRKNLPSGGIGGQGSCLNATRHVRENRRRALRR